MDLVAWAAPALAAMFTAALLSMAGFLRKEFFDRVPGRLVAVGGFLLFCGYLLATRFGLVREIMVPTIFFARALGIVLLGAAALLAIRGSRARRQAELLLAQAPRSLDEAVEALRAGGSAEGVFRGRLASSEQVTSPAGLVCAFYEAEVREVAPGGQKGSLISLERAFPPALSLEGDRVECDIDFLPEAVLGPVAVRRCKLGSEVAMSAAPLLASGDAPTEALSYERVGKLGDACLVAGRLTRTGAELGYRIRRGLSTPVTVVLGNDATAYGKRFAKVAWLSFLGACGLCALSAYVLAKAPAM